MGRRGPAPLPTAEKILRGVRPGRINLAEPLPRQRPPRIPPHLSPEARVVWRAVLRESAPGQIVAADGLLLEQLSEAVVALRECRVRYRRTTAGLARARGDGRRDDAVIVHPVLRPLRFWSDEVLRLSRELGLCRPPGPRSTSRVRPAERLDRGDRSGRRRDSARSMEAGDDEAPAPAGRACPGDHRRAAAVLEKLAVNDTDGDRSPASSWAPGACRPGSRRESTPSLDRVGSIDAKEETDA